MWSCPTGYNVLGFPKGLCFLARPRLPSKRLLKPSYQDLKDLYQSIYASGRPLARCKRLVPTAALYSPLHSWLPSRPPKFRRWSARHTEDSKIIFNLRCAGKSVPRPPRFLVSLLGSLHRCGPPNWTILPLKFVLPYRLYSQRAPCFERG